MIKFVNILLTNLFGTGVSLMTLEDAFVHLSTAPSWIMILDPTFIFSFVTYVFSFAAIWQIVCVYPFRLLKKLIKYPGKEK